MLYNFYTKQKELKTYLGGNYMTTKFKFKYKYIYKDSFAVIGKAGQGPADNPQSWILPLWDVANKHYEEIAGLVRKNENGVPLLWGAMNDEFESNKRWGAVGKYMAGGEVDIETAAPKGWTKWVIPAQTYLVAACQMDEYLQVFTTIVSALNNEIIGTVHEHYPDPGNPNKVEIYFPIAKGKMSFCQSCFMQMDKPEKFGKELNGEHSQDYCCYCYNMGNFTKNQTFVEAVESDIQFWREGCKDDDEARMRISTVFTTLKRWKNEQ